MVAERAERVVYDIVAVVGGETALRFAAGTRGGELKGPCPFCGGSDRFRVQPARGTWFCRACTGVGDHDAIDYVRRRDGVGFRQAQARLLHLAPIAAPAREARPTEPTDEARLAFARAADACRAALLERPPLLDRIERTRGLRPETVRRAGLGVCLGAPGERWAQIEGLRVPVGLVIPKRDVRGILCGLKVRRRPGDEPKYLQVAGSLDCLYGARTPDTGVAVIVEGEFDALLLGQILGPGVDVVTPGSATAAVREDWFCWLLGYRRRIVWMDNDAEGERAAGRWMAAVGTHRVAVPWPHKDLTAAHLAGEDVAGFFCSLLDLWGID